MATTVVTFLALALSLSTPAFSQAVTMSMDPITQIPDGQIQAPTGTAAPMTMTYPSSSSTTTSVYVPPVSLTSTNPFANLTLTSEPAIANTSMATTSMAPVAPTTIETSMSSSVAPISPTTESAVAPSTTSSVPSPTFTGGAATVGSVATSAVMGLLVLGSLFSLL